jgi:hypothetical protein
LTFIGCALAYISLFVSVARWGNYEQDLADAQKMEEKMAGDSKLMEGSVEMVKKTHENRYAIAATNLVFTTFCLVGALRMRKLRKSGYPLYLVGELAPLAVSAALLGFNLFGGIVLALTAFFALLFVILYTTQRKYLIYS